jgi:excisionase family DNA binding protein
MSSALSSPSPAWLSQKEAAEALGVTERTIRRLCSDGKLGSRVQPVLGRKPVVLIDQRDVDRILAERVRPLAVTSGEALPLRHGLSVVNPADIPPDSAVSSVSLPPMGEVEHFVRLLETIVKARQLAPPSPALVPHMTLKEAAEYSGLPAAYLVAGARAGTIRAVNVGSGKREFWRFPKT